MKLILLFALAIPALFAQDEVISLTDWKTHPGDDLRWAAQEFDDSAWESGSPRRSARLGGRPPRGSLVLAASAGHPNPYLDGLEVELDAGLPLGIADDATYKEVELRLLPGSQITLVSDGVVEAANRKNELFGFDRKREISGQSAQEIADAAKAWGQNDDITVVTVRRSR